MGSACMRGWVNSTAALSVDGCRRRRLPFAMLCSCSGLAWRCAHCAVCARSAARIAGTSELVAAVRAMHNVLGGTIDPHASYLLLRGMKTLDLRVQRQNATAMEIARRLEAHPQVWQRAAEGVGMEWGRKRCGSSRCCCPLMLLPPLLLLLLA